MSERHINPEELAALDEEQAFLNSSIKQNRRIKIEKNQVVTVRFLPVEFGPKKWFYQRISYHWIGTGKFRRPYYCHRHTAVECGGDPNGACDLCDETEKLNNHPNQNIAANGYRSMAQPQWLLYCLMFEKDLGGEIEKVRGADKWKAWEFPMTKNNFAIFLQTYRRSLKRCDKGILNLEEGNDISVSLPGRDYTFQKEDSCPIYDMADPEKFQDIINKIWSSLQIQNFRPLTDEAVEKALEKLDESVSSATKTKKRRGEEEGEDYTDVEDRPRRRAATEEEDRPRSRRVADEEDRPRSRRTSDETDEAPRRRSVNVDAPEPEGEPVEDDGSAEDVRPRAPKMTPPSVVASSRATPPPPAAKTQVAAPPASRVAPPPAAKTTPPPVSKPTPPVVASTPPPQTTGAASSVDEDDNVTDENKDPAPVVNDVADVVSEPATNDEAPPAVTTGMTPPNLKSRLQRGIAAAKERL